MFQESAAARVLHSQVLCPQVLCFKSLVLLVLHFKVLCSQVQHCQGLMSLESYCMLLPSTFPDPIFPFSMFPSLAFQESDIRFPVLCSQVLCFKALMFPGPVFSGFYFPMFLMFPRPFVNGTTGFRIPGITACIVKSVLVHILFKGLLFTMFPKHFVSESQFQGSRVPGVDVLRAPCPQVLLFNWCMFTMFLRPFFSQG